MDAQNYIQSTQQNFLMTDISGANMSDIEQLLDVKYLQTAEWQNKFPAAGSIVGLSNYTYLSKQVIYALTGNTGNTHQTMRVFIHCDKVAECHASPDGSQFESVNVLGMDFSSSNKVTISINSDSLEFTLQQIVFSFRSGQ